MQTAALLVGAFLLARICLALPGGYMRIAPVWLPSALTLAVLLRTPERRWPLLVSACVAGHATAGLSTGFPPVLVAVRALCSALEYVGAAVGVRQLVGRDPEMGRGRHIVGLCLIAAAASVSAGGVQSLLLGVVAGADMSAALRSWLLSHPLSLVMATPCLLVLTRPRRHLGEVGLTVRARWALAATGAVVLLVFTQSRLPLLFLAPPALVAVSLEAGLFGAALAVLITTAVALPATALGMGPIPLGMGDASEKAAVLQLFLAVSLFSSLPVAALQARWRKAEALALQEAQRAQSAEAAALAGEARHRALTDMSPDMIGTMSLKGEITFISPAAQAVAMYAPEDLIGRDIAQLIHPDDLPAVRRNFATLLQTDADASSPIEYRLLRGDGEWVWLQANPRLLRDADGHAVGTIDVVRDVSARKAMEARLEAALRDAQVAGRAKAEFLANMSHELRTPLTGILGYAELLRGEPSLSPEARSHADRIGAAGSMLLALVNDVLDLSRMEARGVQLQPRPADLAALVRGAIDIVSPQAAAAALAVCSETSDGPPPVCVDVDRLQQIVVNLLGNAVKFTRRGVVSVRLQGAVAGSEANFTLSVADTGCGIPAERLEAIFERFEQIDTSSSRTHGGAGLGLAISRRLARAMGGDITVESAVGCGSVFTLRLRAPLAAGAQTPKVLAPPPPPTDADAGSPLRVLLAEDVAMNRDLLALMLKPMGVSLTAVTNGAEAVEAAGVEAFDLVLMDLQMPVMDGLEAVRRIRRGAGPSAGARVVALTANVLPEEVARCLAAGMDAHVAKPVSAASLAEQLRLTRAPDPSRRAA